ncbi:MULTISPECIES: AIPR family protein [unclassified Streptomyces]|uniref:AIPR family protein n=1 Tax=unclassified Streptomyces TaxID=2593676 RepID=UPI0038008748
MTSNDLVLIDQLLKQRQQERVTPLTEDKAFEVFACEQAVTLGELSLEEIEAGVLGGGNDGAIDGVYVFLGERILAEDSEVLSDGFKAATVERGTRLTLWIVQAKTTPSFTETALDLVSSSARRLLDLSASEEDLRQLYNESVVERVGRFRTALRALATRHPKIEIRFSYATRGDTEAVNAKVLVKVRDLELQFSKVTAGATGQVELLGAAELWTRANSAPSYTLALQFQESITHGTSHIVLVKIRDYLAFLCEEDGSLRRHIFDWNVRDYQGEVEVNREIRASLVDVDAPQFWWLNNGVTIVCSRVSTVGKEHSLDDVQIVNGLQTSHTLHRTLGELATSDEEYPALERLLQVRVLVTEDAGVRDQVIRATNRQTSVPVASLHATDEIQRQIEKYFLENDWFYDRRKNYYRNQGRPASRVVSIPLLAQAVMAMGLSQPHNSRSRPSSLLKDNTEYKRIFSANIPLNVYLWLARMQSEVDSFLSSDAASAPAAERTNLRFHLAMLAAAELMGRRVRSPKQLKQIAADDRHSTADRLSAQLQILRSHFEEHSSRTGDTQDKIAKRSDFVESLLAKIGYL